MRGRAARLRANLRNMEGPSGARLLRDLQGPSGTHLLRNIGGLCARRACLEKWLGASWRHLALLALASLVALLCDLRACGRSWRMPCESPTSVDGAVLLTSRSSLVSLHSLRPTSFKRMLCPLGMAATKQRASNAAQIGRGTRCPNAWVWRNAEAWGRAEGLQIFILTPPQLSYRGSALEYSTRAGQLLAPRQWAPSNRKAGT